VTQFFNRSAEKEKRRRLRNDMPSAENVVWSRLRRKLVCGNKFRRQYSVGPFVIDFYCPSLKLAVEIDGESHYAIGANDHDEQRQAFIESFGISFLRFTNRDVYDNLTGVMETITRVAEAATRNSGPEIDKSPPYEGGDIGEVT
jgi:very-short-patch-repair endonuclease